MSSTHAKTTMKTLRGLDTRIVGNKQQPLAINYRLHSVDKEWKIYDLVIEHISVVNNYRSQFDRIIARSSSAELLGR